jgi:hypothetical protein
VSITKVVLFFATNPTKLSLHFSKFSTNFYAFYNFCKRGFTIEDSIHTEVPGIFYSLTDRSLVCTKHPTKKFGLAIGPLAMGGSGLAGNPAAPAELPAGKRRGMTVGSPRAWGWSELEQRARWRGDSAVAGGSCCGGAGSGVEGARGGQCASLGGSTGPRGEGGAVGRR